jgi:hypothetical protein
MKKPLFIFILFLISRGLLTAQIWPAPASPHPEWSVYTDNTFGFSIRHPVPKAGQHAKTRAIPGAVGTTELPTGNDKSGILLSVFTDENIRLWNNQPGTAPFPYSPEAMRAALQAPVGTPISEVDNAIVVSLNNHKALRFIKIGPYGDQITHFFQRGKNGWLEINLILWEDRNLSHLTQTRPVPYEVQKALDAGQSVLNTIGFFNPRALPTPTPTVNPWDHPKGRPPRAVELQR